jgi:GxxExxY protein
MEKSRYNELSAIILDSAITVHKEMGPGLLESIYQHCLVKELQSRSVQIEMSVVVPLMYKGENLGKDYIADLIIERLIIAELKAVEIILPIHEAQIISYLKITDMRLGFLINFNVPLLKYGFKRFVNNF